MTTRSLRPDSRTRALGARVGPEKARARAIVVLDADPRARATVVGALTAEGFRATATGDTSAAVRAARSEGADLVLADLSMSVLEVVPRWARRATDGDPGKAMAAADGYAVLRPLQLDAASFRHLAVFLREGASASLSAVFRFGVLDYVPKPIDVRLLVERMEEIFERLEAPPGPNVLELISSPPKRSPRASDADDGALSWSDDRPADVVPVPVFQALPKALRTVLIADPDVGSRGFVKRLLEPHGFTVYEAEDGKAALALALQRRPWMIVSEVNMPRMDGFEFCRQVRSHALLRHTPLIFYAGWDDYTERYLGLKLGADEYLSKLTPVREVLIRLQLMLKKYSDLGTRTRKGPGMEGTIELIGTTGMLQLCHLSRLTGVSTVKAGNRTAAVSWRDGEIVAARCGGAKGAEAIYAFLGWMEGDFAFTPGEPGESGALNEAFDYLLLEGCRRLDEAARPAD